MTPARRQGGLTAVSASVTAVNASTTGDCSCVGVDDGEVADGDDEVLESSATFFGTEASSTSQ